MVIKDMFLFMFVWVSISISTIQEKDIRAFCKYEESLVHLVLAASDIFVNVSIQDDEITVRNIEELQ
jgi:hypothetical protein